MLIQTSRRYGTEPYLYRNKCSSVSNCPSSAALVGDAPITVSVGLRRGNLAIQRGIFVSYAATGDVFAGEIYSGD